MSEREQITSIFQRVSTHLLTQMRKAEASVDDGSECRYRKPLEDGTVLCCAVGCLIPDHVYDPRIEGNGLVVLRIDGSRWSSWDDDPNCVALARIMNESGIPPTKAVASLLRRLQDIHDCANPASWHELLVMLARELDLDPPMLPCRR